MTKRSKKKLLWLIPVLLLAMVIASVCYVNDYYHADASVEQYLENSGTVKVKNVDVGLFLDGPGNDQAMIFYPGAKVEYTAYVPLLHKLAEQGVDVFLVKMPCNLAFLGQNKASDIIELHEYAHWYIGGHSLGGAMAASFAAKQGENLDGLVLLAAYPTKQLPQKDFSVVSIYGSEDGVLNMEKLESGRAYMPKDYTEICIDGGNHAQYGNYGVQKGDGEARITRKEQQKQTVEAILRIMKK